MNIKRAQKEVFAALLNGDSVAEGTHFDGQTILSVGGVVGYVFPPDANRIDLTNVLAHLPPLHLHEAMLGRNEIRPTEHLIEYKGLLLRLFIKTVTGDKVYVQDKHLKNFDGDTVRFYQEGDTGPVVVAEDDDLEGEHVVGFIMPGRVED